MNKQTTNQIDEQSKDFFIDSIFGEVDQNFTIVGSIEGGTKNVELQVTANIKKHTKTEHEE